MSKPLLQDQPLMKIAYRLLFLGLFLLPLLYAPALEHYTRLKPSNLLFLICGLLVAVKLFWHRHKPEILKANRILLLFLTFNIVSFLLHSIFSTDPGHLLQEEWMRGVRTLIWMTFGVMVVMLIGVFSDTRGRYLLLLKGILLSCTLFSLVGLYQYIGYIMGFSTGQRFTELLWLIPRLSSTALEPLYFANILVLFMPMSILCYLTGTDLFHKRILMPMVGVQLLAILLTFSAGGWFASAAGLLTGVFILRKRVARDRIKGFLILVLVLVLILVLLNSFFYPDLVYGFKGTFSKVVSVRDIGENYTRIATASNVGVSFEQSDFAPRLQPGGLYKGSIVIANEGTLTWESRGMVPVIVIYQWQDDQGNMIEGPYKTRIKRDVTPGEAAEVELIYHTPAMEGNYLLIIDVEQHNVGRFSSLGAQVLHLPVEIRPSVNVNKSYIVEKKDVPDAPVQQGKEDLDDYFPNSFSSLDRMWLITAGWNMFQSSPLYGVGLGQSGYLYNEYKPAYAQEKNFIASINNQYMEIMAETGLIGLAALSMLLIFLSKRIYHALRTERDPVLRTVLIGLIGGFIGLGIQLNLFSGSLTLNYVWAAVGMLFALLALSTKNQTMGDEAS